MNQLVIQRWRFYSRTCSVFIICCCSAISFFLSSHPDHPEPFKREPFLPCHHKKVLSIVTEITTTDNFTLPPLRVFPSKERVQAVFRIDFCVCLGAVEHAVNTALVLSLCTGRVNVSASSAFAFCSCQSTGLGPGSLAKVSSCFLYHIILS